MAGRFLRIVTIFAALTFAPNAHAGGPRDTAVANALPGTPRPAVIFLHGAGGSGHQMQNYIGIDTELGNRGIVALYPTGLNRQWNAVANLSPRNDVKYLDDMIAYYTAQRIVDPTRIYIAGISNGGMMVQKMLCASQYKFLGAAVVVSAYPEMLDCPAPKPTPLVFINGTEDEFFPLLGKTGKRGWKGIDVWGWEKTWAFWANLNGCQLGNPLKTQRMPVKQGQAGITRVTYRVCAVPFDSYVISHMGHVWPGGVTGKGIERALGANPAGIRANDILLRTWFGGR